MRHTTVLLFIGSVLALPSPQVATTPPATNATRAPPTIPVTGVLPSTNATRAPPAKPATGAPPATNATRLSPAKSAGGFGALLGGLDLGGLLGSLGGGGGGGLDLGALLSGFGGGNRGANADINIIVAGYKDVESKLTDLDTAVKALGNSTYIPAVKADIITKSQAVTAALKAATAKVSNATTITDLFASTELMAPRDSVSALLETTVNDLIEKKAMLDKVAILKELNDQKDAISAFKSAINSKLPSIAKSIASGKSQQPIITLEKGIEAFT